MEDLVENVSMQFSQNSVVMKRSFLFTKVEMVSTNYSAENYSVRCLRALIGVHTGARRWFADVKFILL